MEERVICLLLILSICAMSIWGECIGFMDKGVWFCSIIVICFISVGTDWKSKGD